MNYVKRIMIYTLGLFMTAIGVSISVKSNLGVSPVNAIPYALSLVLKVEMGTMTTMVFITFIVIQILILRKDFKPHNLLQIIASVVFGFFVTVSNTLLSFLAVPQTYVVRILFLIVSIFFVAFGLLLYLNANILALPAEGVMQAIEQKSSFPFHKIKITFDYTVVLISALISIVCLGRLLSVREGTLIAAFGVGKVLHILGKTWKPKITAFLSDAVSVTQ